jgi:hypothetical protein
LLQKFLKAQGPKSKVKPSLWAKLNNIGWRASGVAWSSHALDSAKRWDPDLNCGARVFGSELFE